MPKINVLSLLLGTLLLTSLSYAQEDDTRSERISARGQKDITFGTLLSPPGLGARGRAKIIAKKELKKKCKEEFHGKIKGEVEYKLVRFDEGCMCAVVEASGLCKY